MDAVAWTSQVDPITSCGARDITGKTWSVCRAREVAGLSAENGVAGRLPGALGGERIRSFEITSQYTEASRWSSQELLEKVRLVSDYHVENAIIEKAALPMPDLESMALLFENGSAFCTLDLLQGYW